MKKRILSMFLVLCMVLGLFPTAALAQETNPVEDEQSTTTEQATLSETSDSSGMTMSEIMDLRKAEIATLDVTENGYFPGGGTGVFGDPFIIRDAPDLRQMAALVNGSDYYYVNSKQTYYYAAHYQLLEDATIDYSVDDLNNDLLIGNNVGGFSGVFDGNNATIDLNVTRYGLNTELWIGLFIHIADGGIVKNLHTEGNIALQNTEAYLSQGDLTTYAGGIAGKVSGLLINSTSNVAITSQAQTGTTVGYSDYTTHNPAYGGEEIDYVSGHTNWDSTAYAGGIAGHVTSTGYVINCGSYGSVNAFASSEESPWYASDVKSYAYGGGVAGRNQGTVLNCFDVGTVTTSATISPYNATTVLTPIQTGDTVDNPATTSTVETITQYDMVTKDHSAGKRYSHAYSGGVVGINEGSVQNTYHGVGTLNATSVGGASYTVANRTDSSTVTSSTWTPIEREVSSTSSTYNSNLEYGVYGISSGGSATNSYWYEDSGALVGSSCNSASYMFDNGGKIQGEIDLWTQLHTWVKDRNYALTSANSVYNDTIYDPDSKVVASNGVISFEDIYTTYRLYQWMNDSHGGIVSPSFMYRINVVEKNLTTGGVIEDADETEGIVSTKDKNNASVTDPNFALDGTDNIVITIDPKGTVNDPLYTVVEVKVLASNGVIIEAKMTTNNPYEYTFSMPDCSVAVIVTYKELTEHGCTNSCCSSVTGSWVGIEHGYKFTELQANTNYYFKTDVVTDDSSLLKEGTHICLNGFNVTSSSANPVFSVQDSITATICGGDSTTGIGTITSTGGVGIQVSGGNLSLYTANVTGNSGYGVDVTSGSTSGKTGTFTMVSGTISNNSNIGVNVQSGTFNMEGGTITENGSRGVKVAAGTTFNMTGGSVDNTGGVYVEGTMNVSDSPVVTSTGGGVQISQYATKKAVQVTGVMSSSASVYVTPVTTGTAIEKNKLAEGTSAFAIPEILDNNYGTNGTIITGKTGRIYSPYTEFFKADGTVFYRPSQKAIYVSHVTPTAQDFVMTYTDADGVSNKPSIVGDYFQIEMEYTGAEPNLTVESTIYEDSYSYTLSYTPTTANVTSYNVGSYDVYLTVKNSAFFESGSHKIGELTIIPQKLEYQIDYDINPFPMEDEDYTGAQLTPPITVTLKSDGTVLTPNVDYVAKYVNNIDVGTAKIHVVGAGHPDAKDYGYVGNVVGNYEFYKEHTFEIVQEETTLVLTNKDLIDEATMNYGGVLPVKVKPAMNNVVVTDDDYDDYTINLYKVNDDNTETLLTTEVTFASNVYTINYNTVLKELDIGKHTLRVRFVADDNYTNLSNGKEDFTITIDPKPLVAKVAYGQSRAYNGSVYYTANLAIETVSVSDGSFLVTNNLLEKGDSIYATATGFVSSAAVGSEYKLTVTSTALYGANGVEGEGDSKWYTLAVDQVGNDNTVAITQKNLKDSDVEREFFVEVMQGVGTFATPEISYEVDGEDFVVTGSMTYTHSTYDSYDKIVAHLKEQTVPYILSVNYSFTADNPSNYTNPTITGTIHFNVVDIKFDADSIKAGINFPENPIYGDPHILQYDPSKFIAIVGSGTTTGAYTLTVVNSLGVTITDYSMLTVGTYVYSITFTSYDNIYNDVFVTEGNFTVYPREAEIEWDSLNFTYDGTAKLPTATIANTVWGDNVSISVSGAQTNVSPNAYTAQLELKGDDRNNYTLSANTVNFTVSQALVKGIVSVTSQDNDNSGTLTAGDVLTADVSSVSPSGGTVFYHWYRNNVPLASGSTWPSYTVTSSDVDGTNLRCEVTFSGNTTGTISSTGMIVGNTYLIGNISATHLEGILTAEVTDTNTDDYTIYWAGVSGSATGTTYNMNVGDYDNTVTITVIAKETSDYTGSFNTTIKIASTKPNAPVISVVTTDTTATVSWEAPYHGGASIEYYTLSVTDQLGNDAKNAPYTLGSGITSYTVAGLTTGETYTFNLVATNKNGNTASLNVLATMGAETDTDTDGEISTSTTVTEYVDEDGNEVTKTVTIESNTSDGTVKTTTEIRTESEDGTVTVEVESVTVDGTGEVIERYNSYTHVADGMTIISESLDDGTTSKGSLDVTTEVGDRVSLPVSLVQTVVDKNISSLTVTTPNAELRFDTDALSAMFAKARPSSKDTLEIIAEYTSADKMPNSVKDRLSTAFIMDFTVKLGGVTVSEFGEGSVQVVLPYSKNDTSKNISVYHVADITGAMTRLADASYQNDSKTVTFSVNHFSYYAVLEEGTAFYDVNSSDYFYNSVLWAVESGITSGTTSNTFSPFMYCNRSEAVQLLWNAMGKNIANIYIPFEDVTPGDFYYEAVRWAYAEGITSGYSPARFQPWEVCSRSQIITFIWIANGRPAVDTDDLYFSDVPVGSWYSQAVQWAVSEGITSGTSSTKFSPDEPCTRAEIVTFLYNSLH